MTSIDEVIKPKTQRSRRFLEQRGPRNNENDKSAMFLRGGNVSNVVTQGLKDLYALKKPTGVLYKRKNMTRPFEDQTSLEFFSKKSDCSLFAFGSHSKKRPNNLTFGRMYDHHVLDMYEFGIERFVPLKDFKNAKFPEGTKPMLLFAGNNFDNVEDYKRFKNLMIDFFRGPKVPAVRLAGLEHLIQISAWKGFVFFRSYKVFMKKSGCRTPRVELEEIGPSFDLVLRRTLVSTDDLFKLATKRPKAVQAKKKKNISHDTFGTKYGRIHMQKQDLSKLQTRKVKALKKSPEEKVIAEGEDETPKRRKTGIVM